MENLVLLMNRRNFLKGITITSFSLLIPFNLKKEVVIDIKNQKIVYISNNKIIKQNKVTPYFLT